MVLNENVQWALNSRFNEYLVKICRNISCKLILSNLIAQFENLGNLEICLNFNSFFFNIWWTNYSFLTNQVDHMKNRHFKNILCICISLLTLLEYISQNFIEVANTPWSVNYTNSKSAVFQCLEHYARFFSSICM